MDYKLKNYKTERARPLFGVKTIKTETAGLITHQYNQSCCCSFPLGFVSRFRVGHLSALLCCSLSRQIKQKKSLCNINEKHSIKLFSFFFFRSEFFFLANKATKKKKETIAYKAQAFWYSFFFFFFFFCCLVRRDRPFTFFFFFLRN